jgi:phage terminase small subunit
MAKLTEKQEAACQAYIECGGNQSEAYRMVYSTENMKPETVWQEASRLFALPHVAARVIELQSLHAERHNVTIDTITKELDEAKELAKECEQPAAMTGAIMGKAKIHGLVTDKKELSGKDGGAIQISEINFIPVSSK